MATVWWLLSMAGWTLAEIPPATVVESPIRQIVGQDELLSGGGSDQIADGPGSDLLETSKDQEDRSPESRAIGRDVLVSGPQGDQAGCDVGQDRLMVEVRHERW